MLAGVAAAHAVHAELVPTLMVSKGCPTISWATPAMVPAVRSYITTASISGRRRAQKVKGTQHYRLLIGKGADVHNYRQGW